jgi:mannose/fructose/N-acetylgalactosamine-specific phosphotransferase system component IIB
MPVVHMRIDNRLIHGQVTSSWVNAIGANRLIVTNDQVAKDPVQTMLLPQAARGVPTSVLSVTDTIAYAQGAQAQREKIFVIAKLPSDALRLLEGGLQPQAVNVGNQAPSPGTKFKMVTNSIAVTAEDAETYRKVAGLNGGRLSTQMVPTERQLDFLEVLKQKGF